MALSVSATAVSGNQIAISWSGQADGSTITIYRTTTSVTPGPSTLTDSNKIAEGLTGDSYDDKYTGAAVYYYVYDGTSYASAASVGNNTMAPEIKYDFVPASLINATEASAFVAAQNASASAKIKALPLDTDSPQVFVVAIQGDSSGGGALTEAKIAAQLKGIAGVTYEVLASGELIDVDDYEPQLSGSLSLKYVPVE